VKKVHRHKPWFQGASEPNDSGSILDFMKDFDVIVIGAGAMGSAVLYQLARRGLKVMGIERFGIAHDQGSSSGETRMIRKAYFEHPDYVPLLHEAYRLWYELEQEADTHLFHRNGLFLAGPSDGPVISGVRQTARAHQLPIEEVPLAAARARWPQLNPDDSMAVLYEADAGYLDVASCIRAHIERASALGAVLMLGTEVTRWQDAGGAVRVWLPQGDVISADYLVVCAGAWAGSMMPRLRNVLTVRRKPVFWFPITSDRFCADRECPAFGFETPDGFFYGFPAVSQNLVKLGNHSGGTDIERPDELDRTLREDDGVDVRRFAARHLSGVSTVFSRHSVCMYTMTPDEHFILDRFGTDGRIVVAAGFSGHGFKFAPVMGAIVTDWITQGKTSQPVALFASTRFEA
ncbi:MAG: N-methyl-L-tryptophan oxidase, partial [Phycisphaerae bacterium]